MSLIPLLCNQNGINFLYKPLGNRPQAAIVTTFKSHKLTPGNVATAALYSCSTNADIAFMCGRMNFESFRVPARPRGKVKMTVRKVSYESLDMPAMKRARTR